MALADVDGLLHRVRAIVREGVVLLEPDFLAGGFAAVEPRLQALRERVREEGLLAPHLPGRAGAAPACPCAEFGRLSEELGWSPLGHYVFNCQAPDVGNMELLLHHGSAGAEGAVAAAARRAAPSGAASR